MTAVSPESRRDAGAQDLEDCQKKGGVLDEALQGLKGESLAMARAAAKAAVDALMLTDAPLLFPPGQLALAAMRSGCNKVAPWHTHVSQADMLGWR